MNRIIIGLILLLGSFNFYGQNVLVSSDLYGKSMPSHHLNKLKSISKSIDSLLLDTESFTIVDAAFYGLSSQFGSDFEQDSWTSLKSEAASINSNYLLLGRQYTSGGNGFKLWIDLNIPADKFKCYYPEDSILVQSNLDTFQLQLEEWFDYLTASPTDGDFDAQYKVAKLAVQKLRKVCCDLLSERGRSSCSSNLDIQEMAKEKDLKYYILGKIKCLSFDGSCTDYHITSGIELGAIMKIQFVEDEFSAFVPSDLLDKLGYVHIYLPEFPTSSIRCIPEVRSSSRQQINQGGYQFNVNVDVYDFGRFIVVVKSDLDLITKLLTIKEELKQDILQLINYGMYGGSRPDQSFENLNYVSECDFFDLKELDKVRLLEFFVSDRIKKWYEVLKWWSDKYSYFIFNLYNEIGRTEKNGVPEKLKLFEYQKGNREQFILNFLNYDFNSAYKSAILNAYCEDYLEYTQVGNSNFEQNGKLIDELYYLPYEVNKFYGFFYTNYDFSFENAKVKIKADQSTNYTPGTQSQNISEEIDVGDLKLLSPVLLPQLDLADFEIKYNLVPAVILLDIERYLKSENLFQSLLVSADVLSILSGVGVFSNASKLAKLGLFLGRIEVASTTINSVITNTDLIPDTHQSLKKKILVYLTCLEMVSGMADPDGILKVIRNFGRRTLDEAIVAGQVVKPNVKSFIAKTLSQSGLLARIPEGPLKVFVGSLDEVRDVELINQLNQCSTPLLLQLNKIEVSDYRSTYLTFVDDIKKDIAFLEDLNAFPGRVKAWKVVDDIGTNAVWRRTPEFLQKVSNIIDDANLRNVIKGSGSGTPEQELTKILTTLQVNPCAVCNAASNNLTLRPIEGILDDIADAASNIPNYSTANIVSQFKIGGISKNRGWAFELRQVVQKNNASATYGGQIPNAQHGSKFDMRVGDKLDEFKSTQSITGTLYNPSNSSNKINQLLDYIGGVNKADDLKITFDSKALGTGISATDEMKIVVENLKSQIFPRMNASLRNDLGGLDDLSDFDATVINNLVNKIVKTD